MRNITLSNFESCRINNLKDCQVFFQDRQRLFAYDKGIVISRQGNHEEVICNLTESLYPVTDPNDIPKALDIVYCFEKDLIYIILTNGDIVSLQDTGNGTETVIGTVDGCIKAAQWSPDQEVVAIITGNDVMVMTNDFDPVSNVGLHDGGFGEKQFITVGWGKKETQFRGSEGKFNNKDKAKESVDVAAENNNEIHVSWRGDAEYFAVSCINPETSQRYLRIFNKSGILQYTSEPIQGLESCLDWRPSGNLIASTQKLPNKYNVCFLEKNGLKHGEFTLQRSYNEIKVNKVLWNSDSRILALLVTPISESSDIKNKYIEFYTMSNYHWYCKYTITFDSDTEPLLLKWDCQKHSTFHVIIRKGNGVYHNKYSWLWVTNKSKGKSLKDESFVAVIDGCNLKLTSFKRNIMPPPMCNYTIVAPATINSVSFATEDTSSNDLIIQLCNGSMLFYKFVDEPQIRHELLGIISGLAQNCDIFYNPQWISDKTVVTSLVKLDGEVSKPFLCKIDIDNFQLNTTFTKKEFPLKSAIAILKASKSGVAVSCNNGQMLEFNTAEEISPLYPNDNKILLDFEIIDNENGSFDIVGLDNLNKFYINNRTLFSNVLSFHIHEKFILLTTMKHELLCLNFENEMQNSDDLSELCKRRVERGSRLITSVHKDMNVILQMPRGNLECVQPRALSIFVLGKYLDNLKYFEAFDLMRKQRINLNLLYDHNPDLFCENLNIFLDQITDLQWISLFLSDLNDEDVTKTMYSVLYKTKTSYENGSVSKIDLICALIEKTLSKKENAEEYLLPILMTYIKRGTTEYLEAALLKLKTLKEKEARGIKSPIIFDEAFKFILYLIDVDQLYKIALGMYDFDMVLMVANKSQKDPKEYISFLNDLKKLEPNYQKFTIDKHLKRYTKALEHLVLCDEENSFTECLNFIKTHQLYKLALTLIPQNTDRYKNVCNYYAEELMRSHSYEDAGIMYSNAGMYRNAIEAYRKSGNWQEVIACGEELNLNENELNELLLDLAMELCESKQFSEAASVYLDHLKDVEECVRTLCKGKLFAEAYRVSHLHQCTDLIDLVIVPAIAEQGNLMKLQIANFSETFLRQKTRLKVVRKQKQEVNENKIEMEGDDLYSEANSVITQSNATSRSTNRTYRSAKNKRKHERKLLSLKEGSPYEDLALITSLHNIATNCYEMKSEVKNLNIALLKCGNCDMAESLQKEFGNLLKTIEEFKSEIWTPDLLNSKQYYGPEATSNEIAAMFMKSESSAPVLLNPKFAIPPEPQNNVKWELDILK